MTRKKKLQVLMDDQVYMAARLMAYKNDETLAQYFERLVFDDVNKRAPDTWGAVIKTDKAENK